MSKSNRFVFSRLLVAAAASFQIYACSYGHPLVGLFPGEELPADDSALALLAVAGATYKASLSTVSLRTGGRQSAARSECV